MPDVPHPLDYASPRTARRAWWSAADRMPFGLGVAQVGFGLLVVSLMPSGWTLPESSSAAPWYVVAADVFRLPGLLPAAYVASSVVIVVGAARPGRYRHRLYIAAAAWWAAAIGVVVASTAVVGSWPGERTSRRVAIHNLSAEVVEPGAWESVVVGGVIACPALWAVLLTAAATRASRRWTTTVERAVATSPHPDADEGAAALPVRNSDDPR